MRGYPSEIIFNQLGLKIKYNLNLQLATIKIYTENQAGKGIRQIFITMSNQASHKM
jgi:hypothetical protein